MAGVKETFCTNCAHLHVCKYKGDYLGIVDKCNAFSRDTVNSRNDILKAVSVNAYCKFYIREDREERSENM